MSQIKKKFVTAVRLATRVDARRRGLSRAAARKLAKAVTAEQIETKGLEILAENGTPEIPPETPSDTKGSFWDRVKLFWKNWGPLIMQIVQAILPLLIGAMALEELGDVKPLALTDPVRASYLDEFLQAILADLTEDFEDDED